MSLTRKEWEEMWNYVKGIEELFSRVGMIPSRRLLLQGYIKNMKRLIQSVLGQME